MKIKTCAWGIAIAATMAAALSYAFAPQLSAYARQDKQQSNKQDQKKSQQQKQQPQDPQQKEDVPTIKFGTKLVNVLFSVQDKQNHYLNDLKQEDVQIFRSEEHTSELQSLRHLVCRLLLEKKKNT